MAKATVKHRKGSEPINTGNSPITITLTPQSAAMVQQILHERMTANAGYQDQLRSMATEFGTQLRNQNIGGGEFTGNKFTGNQVIGTGRKPLTAAARKKISEATRARWAAKKAQEQTQPTTTGKAKKKPVARAATA